MATRVEDGAAVKSGAELQQLAKRHLWMHFSRLGAFKERDVQIITRGEGCWVWDEKGNRYLDGLSALFCVNLGHSRPELGDAAAEQARELGFVTTWNYAHPRAIELAARIAELAPGDLNRVFFTSGGSEAVESAWKLVRQYHKLRGETNRTKIVARKTAYHGTTLGALSATGVTALRQPFEPLTPGGVHAMNTDYYRQAHPGESFRDFCLRCADSIEQLIEFEGPSTVAAVILEPCQNAGGCFTAHPDYFQRVREICDRHGVIFISDEVICSWGRLGEFFGADAYGYQPDIITTAKGITGAFAPMGAVIASDRIAEPFLEGTTSFVHGFTFGGHPLSAAISLRAIDIYEDEGIMEHVRRNAPLFREMLEGLRDLPIVGDVRGDGYFYAIELVKDQETRESYSTPEEKEQLLRGFLNPQLYERGLICRTDDRGSPIVQFAPPLIAGPDEFQYIVDVVRPVLTEAHDVMAAHR